MDGKVSQGNVLWKKGRKRKRKSGRSFNTVWRRGYDRSGGHARVFALLPYGQEFRLSDGSVARLEKLAEPELCRNEHSENYERPCFGVDVVIEGGTLDHVEISAFQTGWGMAINPRGQITSPESKYPEDRVEVFRVPPRLLRENPLRP